jgi:hypothetical protein
MVRLVFATLGCTCVTNVSTDRADFLRELRRAAHEGSRNPAYLRAIFVEADAFCHDLNVAFAKALVGAMLALLSASDTRVDTGVVLVVGHDRNPVSKTIWTFSSGVDWSKTTGHLYLGLKVTANRVPGNADNTETESIFSPIPTMVHHPLTMITRRSCSCAAWYLS